MNPPGAADPLYVLARRVLLDVVEALGQQQEAVTLAGAQAVYLHTGPAGLAIAEYTTDADIAIHPSLLSDKPLLEEALGSAGFSLSEQEVGRWVTKRELEGREVEVIADLLVPEAVGGPGRRGARLGVHGKRAARKVRGLEAVLVDRQRMAVGSLEEADPRRSLELAHQARHPSHAEGGIALADAVTGAPDAFRQRGARRLRSARTSTYRLASRA